MDCCGARCEGTDGGLGGHTQVDWGLGLGRGTGRALLAWLACPVGTGPGHLTALHGTWQAAEEGKAGCSCFASLRRQWTTPMSLALGPDTDTEQEVEARQTRAPVEVPSIVAGLRCLAALLVHGLMDH